MESNDNNENVFFQTMGNLIDLHEFGSIVNILGDGNCGYHSFLLGLTDIDKNNIRTVIDLRFSLYLHGGLAFQKLKNSTIYGAVPKSNAKK